MPKGEGKQDWWKAAAAAVGLVTAPETATAQAQSSPAIEIVQPDAGAEERMIMCGGRSVELRPGDVRWTQPGGDPFSARGEGLNEQRVNRAFEMFRGANVISAEEEAALRGAMAQDREGNPGVIMPGCRLNAMVFGGATPMRGQTQTEERLWQNVVFAPNDHQMPAGTVQHFAEAQMWRAVVGGEQLTLLLSEACNNFGVLRGPAPAAEAAPERVTPPNCAEAVFSMTEVRRHIPARPGHRLDLRYYIVGQEGVTLPPSVCAAYENAQDEIERLPSLVCHPNCPPEIITNDIETILRERRMLANGAELSVIAQHVIPNVDQELGADGELTIFEDLVIAQRAILVMCVVEVDERTGRVTNTTRIKFSVPGMDYTRGENVARFGTEREPWLARPRSR